LWLCFGLFLIRTRHGRNEIQIEEGASADRDAEHRE